MIERSQRTSYTNGDVRTQAKPTPAGGSDAFQRLLRQEQIRRQSKAVQEQPGPASQGVTFSRHARERLEKRRIGWGPEQNRKLSDAVQSAAQKGAQNSLVLMDGVALVVNVTNRTVVTAMDVTQGQSRGRGPVFTNIDSAVLA